MKMLKNIIIILFNLFFIFWINKVFSYHFLINDYIDWHKIKVLKIFLSKNTKVITSISIKWETLKELKDKVWWISAINWAYFMPVDYWYSQNDTNAPRFFKWISFSKYKNDFGINWVFAFDKKWKPFLVMNNIYAEKPDWRNEA